MSYKNVKFAPWATYELRLAELCLGLSCGNAALGQLLCDMSCIVNNKHSKKITYTT